MRAEQRLHREPDPRARRSLALAATCALALVVAALVVVGVRVQHVRLAYRLDALRVERVRAETLIKQLEIQVATLHAPRRVELAARGLGLTTPGPQQIVRAREFVSGGSGFSAAQAARVEAHVR